MKKMRKLVPAFAMLMVAAIMMSTASFAWFSMNTEATAGGMKVQATTSGGLAIAFGVKGTDDALTQPGFENFKSNVTLAAGDWTNGAYKIKPTSTNLNGTEWYTATATNTDVKTAAAGSWGVVSSANEHYFKSVVYVRSLNEGTTGEPLYVKKVEVSGAELATGLSASGMEQALRVAIKMGDKWLFFAPNYSSSTAASSLSYVSGLTGADDAKVGTVTTYATGEMYTGQNVLIGAKLADNSVVYSTATPVEIYVYFEGEDANCTSALAYNLRDLTVKVSFTTVAPVAP